MLRNLGSGAKRIIRNQLGSIDWLFGARAYSVDLNRQIKKGKKSGLRRTMKVAMFTRLVSAKALREGGGIS